MSDDHSPGDRRQPYSDRGGREGRHAETHDVRREELTNPVGPQAEDTSFAEQLAPVETRPGGDTWQRARQPSRTRISTSGSPNSPARSCRGCRCSSLELAWSKAARTLTLTA
jgi:hypothetical protein